MSVTKIDLLNKRFSRSVIGYSRSEVDQFLLEVAETVGGLVDVGKEMRKKIKQMEAMIKEYRQRDETLRDTLMNTQKVVDDIKASAHREAKLIKDEAVAKAEDTVRKGHERLASIHEDIEGLKRQRTQFEAQLRSLLDAHYRMLEHSDPDVERIEELEAKLTFLKKAE
ncbi:DivIVA domain-containing protein [Salidesulfovibrio brasiliensis]|uniref:DivIVA domain-containing protein n=1 Tax=Salidesulfovibrio brasiliensis TaxID=221711 RepID=UPI0006D25E17|nr:DivIVA domain-containing protein [Salidesulfovibrio brasiliensis]